MSAAGPDGRVMYPTALPIVVCAPLRVCMIELQAGEKIVGDPHIGDSVRWNISPAMYGTGDQATAVIILKPQMPGLDTNLLITTDRRAYYLRLDFEAGRLRRARRLRVPERTKRAKVATATDSRASSREAGATARAVDAPAMITVEKVELRLHDPRRRRAHPAGARVRRRRKDLHSDAAELQHREGPGAARRGQRRQGRNDELPREGPDLHRGPPLRSREPRARIGQEGPESGDQPWATT